MQDVRDRTRIVNLFLELYRLQSGASKQAPVEVVPLSSTSEGSQTTYELRIQHSGRWSSRRITIGPIGEGTGSKSRCFKVIFDDLMVVKIPPRPIATIEEYLAVVNREKRIAEQLMPEIQISASGIAAMLKRIPSTGYEACQDSRAFEQRCAEWLGQSTKLARHLMIGDTFVFFMDLLHHPFLSQHLRSIHGIEAEIAEEIRHYNRILLDLEDFEGRYGDSVIGAFVGMHAVCDDCDILIRQAVEQHGVQLQVTPFMRRTWLFNTIAGQQRLLERASLPPAFCSAIEELLAAKCLQHKEAIDEYRRTVRQFLLRQTVSQNALPLEGIVVNLLDLLACVETKGIAIRDLKPDNIFVSADLTTALLQLQQSELNQSDGETPRLPGGRPALGLIDFETAICFRPRSGQNIEQPMLGGTLSFATPSHFFKNDLLLALYQDLPLVLHLQDWHATTAIVFTAITGDMLFRISKSLLNPLLQTARRAGRGAPLVEAYRHGNQLFWEEASTEFGKKTERYAALLDALDIHLPENAARLLQRTGSQVLASVPAKLSRYLSATSHLLDLPTRNKVAAASVEAIRRYRQTLTAAGSGQPSTQRNELARQLVWLEHWKRAEEDLRHSLQRLESGATVMAARDLLRLLFATVLLGMGPDSETGAPRS